MKYTSSLIISILIACFLFQPVQFALADECPPEGACNDDCCKKREKCLGVDLGCDEDPIDPMGGKFYYTTIDLKYGEDVEYMEITQLYMKRFFSSQSSYKGSLGINWISNLDMSLTEADYAVVIRSEYGALIPFRWNEIGDIESPICATSGLFKSDKGYIWKMKYGTEVLFERIEKDGYIGYRVAYKKDRFGKVINYEYDDTIVKKEISGEYMKIKYYPVKIVQEHTNFFINVNWIPVTDSMGNISYYIESVKDSGNREINYTYKSLEGNDDIIYLHSVTDPIGNSVYYNYLTEDNAFGEKDIVAYKITNKRGYDTFYYFNEPFAIPTHGSDWHWNLRVVTVVDPLGNEENYSFDTNLSMSVFTDKNGNQTLTKYSYMQVNEIIYANGMNQKYFYDEHRNKNKIIDENGNETKYIYDDKGNILSEIDVMGNISSWTYENEYNQWISKTDNKGNVWEREVVAGNVKRKTDPLGNTIQYEYNSFGKVSAKTDALGNKVNYVYDPTGNLLSMTDAEGNALNYAYNEFGDKLTETDAKGNTTTYNYNSLRKLTSVIYPDGGVEEYTYDAIGNVITHKDAKGNITTYEYNEMDKRSAVNYPDGTSITYSYDAFGNLISEIKPRGTWNYSYDEMNRRIKKVAPDGTETLFSYDGASGCGSCAQKDKVSSITDARGNIVIFEYDPLGRKILEKDANNKSIEYVYDENSNLVEYIDKLGHKTKYVYDNSNRLVSAVNHLGEMLELTYDGNGNKIAAKDPKGNITRYEYNKNNMPVKVLDAKSGITRFAYDCNNNRTSVTDPTDNTSNYSYDGQNRLINATDAKGVSESFEYDFNGKLVKKVKSDGSVIEYQYDSMDRLVQKVLPENKKVEYVYDLSGNLISTSDAIGITSYSYDNLNRATDVTYPGNYKVAYEYNELGQKSKMTYPSGMFIDYSYDNLNRLISLNINKDFETNNFAFAYDEKGKRISLNYPNGVKTNYSYDDADRVVTISTGTDAEPALIEKVDYAYDANSNRTSRIDKAGTYNYTYDEISQLTGVVYPNSDTQSYTFDSIGNRLELVKEDANGKETITSVFNELNQLKRTESSNYEGGDIISLSGIIEDENIDKILINGKIAKIKDDVYSLDELKLTPGVNIVTVEVTDLAGNIVSSDYTFTLDDKAKTTYSYDANGNLKTKSEKGNTWTFSWDAENHLIQANSSKEKRVEYGWYDGELHNLAYRKEGINEEKYVYDREHCIAKYDGHGKLLQEFVFCLNTDKMLCRIDGDGSKYYFHQDAINSIVAITDDAGTKVVSYEYDEYGKIRKSTGSLENEIKFTGRWFDEDTGLHYYRARWYDADACRFVSRDPIGFDSGDSNLYRYVNNNPVNFIDPQGLQAEESKLFGGYLSGWGHGPKPNGGSTWPQKNMSCSRPDAEKISYFWRKCKTACGLKGWEKCRRIWTCGYNIWGTLRWMPSKLPITAKDCERCIPKCK